MGDLIDTSGSLNVLIFNSDNGIATYGPALAIPPEGNGFGDGDHSGDDNSFTVSADLNGEAFRPPTCIANSRVDWSVVVARENISQKVLVLQWLIGWKIRVTATSHQSDEEARSWSNVAFNGFSQFNEAQIDLCPATVPFDVSENAEDDT